MGKRLVITYGDQTLFDGEPKSVSWRETETGFTVKAGESQANPIAEVLRLAAARRNESKV